jgi:hypothetical protein
VDGGDPGTKNTAWIITEDRPRSEPLRSRATGLYLEEACKLERWSAQRGKREFIGKAPESLQLYAPMPARFDAHFSVYIVSWLLDAMNSPGWDKSGAAKAGLGIALSDFAQSQHRRRQKSR